MLTLLTRALCWLGLHRQHGWAAEHELLSSAARQRSVKPASKRWQPPEGLTPEDIQTVIAAAACGRDRLLYDALGHRCPHQRGLGAATQGCPPTGLVLPNLKNPSRPVKTAHLAAAHTGLPGDLLLWARDQGLAHPSD